MIQQGSVYAKRTGSYRRKSAGARAPLIVFWAGLIALWFLAACSALNRAPALGDTAELQGQAVVTCSPVCAERGQCGSAADGSQAVLGGQGEPIVTNHDRIFPVDMAVPILESRLQTVETIVTGEQFDLRFYHIQRSDGVNGWVAGWCLATE